MDKVLLIIQREYVTRVRKKAFIIMIFVVPLLILAMGAIITLIAKDSDNLSAPQIVKVLDKTGQFSGKFKNQKNLRFEMTEQSVDDLKPALNKDEHLSALVIPTDYTTKDAVKIYSQKKPGITLTSKIEEEMNAIAINNGMLKNHIDTSLLHSIKSDISLNPMEITNSGTNKTSQGADIAVGIACAVLIYLCLFIYGAQVMRGVIEEKTSRIIEVVISSVKPFQLMLGKIIGVGLVGLTQFAAWIVLSIVSTKIVGHALSSPQGGMMQALAALQTIHFGSLLFYFLFYFLTGYLLYSALFAAVGSAVDSETETQQFMFPVTLPLLFTYILSVSILFRAPDSPLAVWLSMIPFTAPVAMMVRIPFGVPGWQLAISMSLMVVTFIFTTYVAARIYRVGILMYGKKASYKELVKWFFYKE
ncbi:ABC transporter permease [Mucilaginibacter gotjawali]|uniref:ABC-2 type transport system permease protein n=2 Tax=Mucilaginibacter gotjawali TaxID=1550579 RepID=A0A839SEP1_9SPHI|nr:ABC transporter permease [Mucilaginibacter gotjawali]MBB3056028.1 ABC-2 type transport system permease protein [Mucilaginibacter gotjawali]BAU53636.1 ABC-2 family transporter protein [Mucilaginibacter gotjawali]